MYDVGSLFGVDCGAAAIFLKKSAVTNECATRGSFCTRSIGAKHVVRNYHRSCLYTELVSRKLRKKTYREGVKVVTVEQFLKWWFKISDIIVDGMGVVQPSRIGPSPLCYL